MATPVPQAPPIESSRALCEVGLRTKLGGLGNVPHSTGLVQAALGEIRQTKLAREQMTADLTLGTVVNALKIPGPHPANFDPDVEVLELDDDTAAGVGISAIALMFPLMYQAKLRKSLRIVMCWLFINVILPDHHEAALVLVADYIKESDVTIKANIERRLGEFCKDPHQDPGVMLRLFKLRRQAYAADFAGGGGPKVAVAVAA